MSKTGERIIVCGTIRGADGAEAACGECGAAIWPTRGTLEQAKIQGLKMICLDCWMQTDEWSFGGVIHHGEMMPEKPANEFMDALLSLLAGRRAQ